jgi:hypothetical protein
VFSALLSRFEGLKLGSQPLPGGECRLEPEL